MSSSPKKPVSKLVEGVDYYTDSGKLVLTSTFLLRRGYCCNNGCRHCPYTEAAKTIQVTITGLPGKEDDA